MKSFLREVLVTLLLAVTIFFVIQATVPPSVVNGTSMEPNLHQGQRLIINKVVYNFHVPERGDIIIFPNPYNPAEDYIKRVIGLPGEIVELKDGKVYIHQPDGNILTLDEHEYISEPDKDYYLSDIIPPDNYFVLGDNRNISLDSRWGWTVPRQDIIGKAWLSIWPPADFGLAPNYSLP